MVKRCVYCSIELGSEEVLDVCEKCGYGVWGKQMFDAIKSNMETAKEKGDLHQGSVGVYDSRP